ncbi:hypothetical protein CHS0354_033742 [Potamilus streckersoni]|uniref:Uncharacterized protein n=1 Tax=Potamilus streckersoni TaxID=2493646 RepID=A0AAE0VMR0_9BIVA|nr:hypothetical protein CHS0354_033742 [Potamilus streckersoni]
MRNTGKDRREMKEVRELPADIALPGKTSHIANLHFPSPPGNMTTESHTTLSDYGYVVDKDEREAEEEKSVREDLIELGLEGAMEEKRKASRFENAVKSISRRWLRIEESKLLQRQYGVHIARTYYWNAYTLY